MSDTLSVLNVWKSIMCALWCRALSQVNKQRLCEWVGLGSSYLWSEGDVIPMENSPVSDNLQPPYTYSNNTWSSMESVHGNQKVISYSLLIWTYQDVKTGWRLGEKLMVIQSVHSHLPLFNLVLIMDFIDPLSNRPHISHNFLLWNFASCACVLMNRKYK